MKYCTNCGHEIHDEAIMCVNCNTPVEKQKPQKVEPPVKVEEPFVEGTPSKGWTVLGIFLPIVALILFFVNKKKRHQRAKRLKKGMIIGFIVWGVIAVIYIAVLVIQYFIGAIIAAIGGVLSAIFSAIFGSIFEGFGDALSDALSESISGAIEDASPAAFIRGLRFIV